MIDGVQTTLYPGGILNTGFAFNWAKERAHEALPAGPNSGQPWAYERIQEGDETCKDNQALHGEAADLIGKVRENDHYIPEVVDPLSPVTFVDKIKVPMFMACQFTDEQTGGHCPTLARRFTGTSKKWFTFTNGTHVDSLAPETYNRLFDFLELYVAREAPITKTAVIQATARLVFQAIFGIDGMTLPPDPIQRKPTYAAALTRVRGPEAHPHPLRQRRRQRECRLAVSGLREVVHELPDPEHHGSLLVRSRPVARSRTDPPKPGGADVFTWDAHARPLTNFSGDTGAGANGLWTATPPYQWSQDPAGSAVAYVSAPLAADHDRGRRRRGAPLGEVVDAERRSPGHGQRGSSGRQGDLRAERLGAGQHARARDEQEHAARACPQPRGEGRLADAHRPFVKVIDPALLPGARLSRGLAHPRADQRPERRPADLVVRRDGAGGTGARWRSPTTRRCRRGSTSR